MKTFGHDHPRVVAATPGMSPGERKAMWRNGVSAEQLALMEQRSGPAPRPAPAPALTSAATKPAPAPAPASHRAPPNAVRAAGGGGAPVATTTPTPVSASSTTKASSNPLVAAAAGAMAEFNTFHSSSREPDHA